MHSLTTMPASAIPLMIAGVRSGAAESVLPVRKALKARKVREVRLVQEVRKARRASPVRGV